MVAQVRLNYNTFLNIVRVLSIYFLSSCWIGQFGATLYLLLENCVSVRDFSSGKKVKCKSETLSNGLLDEIM